MKKIIIALDPGKKWFAFSILSKKGRLLEYGLLGNRSSIKKGLINNLKSGTIFTIQCREFIKNVRRIKRRVQKNDAVFVLTYERFIARGRSKGNLSEIISTLIGMVITVLLSNRCKKVLPITAAAWKVHRRKHGLVIDNDTLSEHISDSIGVAIYFLVKRDYITSKKARTIVKSINNTDFSGTW